MVADRKINEVTTRFGVLRVKIAYWNGQIVNIAPEYEDCRKLAVINNVSIKQVMMAASLEASESYSRGSNDEN